MWENSILWQSKNIKIDGRTISSDVLFAGELIDENSQSFMALFTIGTFEEEMVAGIGLKSRT